MMCGTWITAERISTHCHLTCWPFHLSNTDSHAETLGRSTCHHKLKQSFISLKQVIVCQEIVPLLYESDYTCKSQLLCSVYSSLPHLPSGLWIVCDGKAFPDKMYRRDAYKSINQVVDIISSKTMTFSSQRSNLGSFKTIAFHSDIHSLKFLLCVFACCCVWLRRQPREVSGSHVCFCLVTWLCRQLICWST